MTIILKKLAIFRFFLVAKLEGVFLVKTFASLVAAPYGRCEHAR